MKRDEIVSRMSAIADSGDVLSDEQIAEYESLETELKRAAATDALISRHAAYRSVAPPMLAQGDAAVDVERQAVDAGFEGYLRSGRPAMDLQRAQAEGTGAAGGFLVPEGFRNIMIERLKAFGGLQAVSDGLTTASGQPLPFPTNDDVSNLGAIAPENASSGHGADLVIGTKMVGAYTYDSNGTGGNPLLVSYELLQDSAFDISGFTGRKLAERIHRKLATDFVNGTGAGEPTGLLSTAGGLSAASAWSSNTAPTYADLLNIVHSVDPAYRDSARWVFNDSVLKLVREIVDGNGRPLLWDYSMQMGTGLTGMVLLGYPVTVDQACPSPSGSNHFGFFGDTQKAFLIRTVRDISLITFMEKYANTRQVGYMAWGRWDSIVQDVNAGVLLTAAA